MALMPSVAMSPELMMAIGLKGDAALAEMPIAA